MKIADTRGMLCPKPIIETKKGLSGLQAGEILTVLIDNETSLFNVCKFLKDNDCPYVQTKESGHWVLSVSPPGTSLSDKPAEEYCTVSGRNTPKGNYVVALTSEIMGDGDDALGVRLMSSFVNILTEMDALPTAVVCYNGGVKLAVDGSPVIDTLKELEIRGVQILLCGTCVDFFGISGKIAAGTISDMYIIACKMTDAGSVIKP